MQNYVSPTVSVSLYSCQCTKGIWQKGANIGGRSPHYPLVPNPRPPQAGTIEDNICGKKKKLSSLDSVEKLFKQKQNKDTFQFDLRQITAMRQHIFYRVGYQLKQFYFNSHVQDLICHLTGLNIPLVLLLWSSNTGCNVEHQL